MSFSPIMTAVSHSPRACASCKESSSVHSSSTGECSSSASVLASAILSFIDGRLPMRPSSTPRPQWLQNAPVRSPDAPASSMASQACSRATAGLPVHMW